MSITTPEDGETVAGANVALEAAVDSLTGVASVEFLVDDVAVGMDASSPYGISWDSRDVPDGTHLVTARIGSPNEDSLAREFLVESALSLENILPAVAFRMDRTEELKLKVRNIGRERQSVRLELWLEKEGEKVANLVRKDIRIFRQNG